MPLFMPLTIPAFVFAVGLTTEQTLGVSDVAVTFKVRDVGTLIYEDLGAASSPSNFVKSLDMLRPSPGTKVFSSTHLRSLVSLIEDVSAMSDSGSAGKEESFGLGSALLDHHAPKSWSRKRTENGSELIFTL